MSFTQAVRWLSAPALLALAVGPALTTEPARAEEEPGNPNPLGEPNFIEIEFPESEWPEQDWPDKEWPERDWNQHEWIDIGLPPISEDRTPWEEDHWGYRVEKPDWFEDVDDMPRDRVVICPADGDQFYRELEEMGLRGDDYAPGLVVVDLCWPYEADPFVEIVQMLDAAGSTCAAEPDFWMRSPEGSQSNAIVVGSTFGRTFVNQKALRRIKAGKAHAVTRGAETIVAILDSGVDAKHPALRGRVIQGWDYVDLDSDASEERNYEDDDFEGGGDDGYGHGTFVAGLTLAVAPDARILPLRVLDDEGRGNASMIAAAIAHAVEDGADVINLSLGMDRHSAAVEHQIRRAIDEGVTVVVAAGNNGRRRALQFPADVEGVISVTALGSGRRSARFADGRRVAAVRAPGRELVGPYPDDQWGQATGTSFSAALVSGAAALVRSRYHDLSGDEITEILVRNSRLKLPRLLR